MAEKTQRTVAELLDSDSTDERELAGAILQIVDGARRLAQLYGAEGECAQAVASLEKLCDLRDGDGEAA